MYFRVSVTKNTEKDSWWLYGNNHETVAWAGQTFPSASHALRCRRGLRPSRCDSDTAAGQRDEGGHGPRDRS